MNTLWLRSAALCLCLHCRIFYGDITAAQVIPDSRFEAILISETLRHRPLLARYFLLCINEEQHLYNDVYV